ncbi:MAG TPA: YceI family protein [Jatrophihabitans sp.]|jgi:polyisoprenoid-binding protein YceI
MTAAVSIPGYVVGRWDFDPVHSEIGFTVRHMMVSKVRGKFTSYTGYLVTAEDPLKSYAEAEIDLSSITTGQEQRDGHLRSSDFFDVEKDPKMTFKSTSIEPNGDDFRVTGDLTIRGITQPVTLDVEVGGFGPDPYGGVRAGFTATGTINRHDYGVSWQTAIEGGGVVVGDKVTINIEIEAVLQT